MSESTRALCQIIEARPFLTLTNEELMLLAYLMEREVAHDGASVVSTTLHGRLVDETMRRREFERGQRNAYDQADAALHAIRTDADAGFGRGESKAHTFEDSIAEVARVTRMPLHFDGDGFIVRRLGLSPEEQAEEES